jgi:hypothetical protein
MDCHLEPELKCYWSTRIRSPRHEALYTAISRDRWEQINQYFHIWKPTDPASRVSPDQKVEYLASCLRTSFARYWRPGTYIAVDECIEPFFGRSLETVIIPSKPDPQGYKI